MSGSFLFPMSSKNFNPETIEVDIKEEMSSKEDDSGEEFFETTEIEIKYEDMDYHLHHNSTAQAHSEDHSDLEAIPSNLHNVECGTPEAQKKDLTDFYPDLLLCKRDCETCINYMKMLREHVRAAHAPPQSIQDPLLIDSLPVALIVQSSSSIQINSEVNEDIVEMGCFVSEEVSAPSSDSDPEYNVESGVGNDHDYCQSPTLTKEPRRQGQGSTKSHTSSQSGSFKSKKENHPSRDLICGECDQSFKYMSRLKEHMRIHTGEKPFECDLCVKRFLRSYDLIIHKRFHTGEKPFECEVCEKRFAQSSSLILHKRTHTGEKPFRCDVCDKSFGKRATLLKHEMIHTGERPYICDVCAMGFKTSPELNIHMRIHTGEKPFKCDLCVKSFSQKILLISHKRNHTGERPYQCDQCEKSFTMKGHLKSHKKIHSGKESVGEVPKNFSK